MKTSRIIRPRDRHSPIQQPKYTTAMEISRHQCGNTVIPSNSAIIDIYIKQNKLVYTWQNPQTQHNASLARLPVPEFTAKLKRRAAKMQTNIGNGIEVKVGKTAPREMGHVRDVFSRGVQRTRSFIKFFLRFA